MLKIRKETKSVQLAVTVKRLAPGPVMIRFLSITNSPLVRVTVVTLGAKLIVSPGEASKKSRAAKNLIRCHSHS